MDMVVNRFEVYFVQLDPTTQRPCVIVSAKELNRALNTVISKYSQTEMTIAHDRFITDKNKPSLRAN